MVSIGFVERAPPSLVGGSKSVDLRMIGPSATTLRSGPSRDTV